MKQMQSFFKNIHKTAEGYVPDAVDLADQGFGDLAMAAWLWDNKGEQAAIDYMAASNDRKTEIYLQFECELQDAIDQHNNAVDDAKNLELIDDHTLISILDPDYKFRHFNQAMYDAGHKPSDF